MSRSVVVISGLVFAGLALFGYQLFGLWSDEWVLLLAGVVHLALVLRFYPRLDAFLVELHYAVLIAALAGVVWVLFDGGGTASGSGGVLLALLRDQWSEPLSYAILGGYVLLVTPAIILAVLALSWIMLRRKPQRKELLAGLFVSSILNIPCDFALANVLSQIVVLDPEKSRSFVFAVGLQSLDSPLILHALVVLVIAVSSWRGWESRHQPRVGADSPGRAELRHPD